MERREIQVGGCRAPPPFPTAFASQRTHSGSNPKSRAHYVICPPLQVVGGQLAPRALSGWGGLPGCVIGLVLLLREDGFYVGCPLPDSSPCPYHGRVI